MIAFFVSPLIDRLGLCGLLSVFSPYVLITTISTPRLIIHLQATALPSPNFWRPLDPYILVRGRRLGQNLVLFPYSNSHLVLWLLDPVPIS